MEYERHTQDEAQKEVFAEFVKGLQIMTTHFDKLVSDFGWAAGQIAGDADTPARLRGMIEFAQAYHQFGMDTAMELIEDNSGVHVEVSSADERNRKRITPGILVGLTGARETEEGKHTFDGIAVVQDRKGREFFIDVKVNPNGSTEFISIIHPD